MNVPDSDYHETRHVDKRKKMAKSGMICAFACLYLKDLLTHLNSDHRDDSAFRRTCFTECFGSDADCYILRNLILKFYITDFDPNPQLRSDSLEEHIIPDQLASESGPESDGGSLGCSFGNDEAEGFDVKFSDSEEEREPEPLPILEILNRFCLKVKEEAMISDKAVERIRTVTISLLKTASQQSKAQVTKILQDNGIDTTNMSGLQDAFLPAWIQ